MDFPGRHPFAVAGNHGLVAGCEVISPARSSAESGGEADGCCLDDLEELAEPEFRGAEPPHLPIPRRSLSDFFNSASDSAPNQGREEEEQVGGDSVDLETDEGHSPPGLHRADSESPEGASVIDPSPRPWKKRCVLVTRIRSISFVFEFSVVVECHEHRCLD
jgi:hypothetical protein